MSVVKKDPSITFTQVKNADHWGELWKNRTKQSAKIQPYAANLTGRLFTVQMDSETTIELLRGNSYLISTQLNMRFTDFGYDWRQSPKQAATEGGCTRSLTKHLKGGHVMFRDEYGCQTSGSH